jgi:aldose 1-epimerase
MASFNHLSHQLVKSGIDPKKHIRGLANGICQVAVPVLGSPELWNRRCTVSLLTTRKAAVMLGLMVLASAAAPASPPSPAPAAPVPAISRLAWGHTPGGEPVDLYTLHSAAGMVVRISSYGGTIVSLEVPDVSGRLADLVLGFDSLEGYTNPGYVKANPYFGALIGRYANRIAAGQFPLDGRIYRLATNDGPNHLHGGVRGFDKVVWDARPAGGSEPRLELHYASKDGEEGYPGNLDARVTYTLTASNELKIDYSATTDRDTVVNLTNHSYFNLNGAGNGDILGHELQVDADRFTPIDDHLIPTGELRPVKGTPFDFTRPTAIGARIGSKDPQLLAGKGYDHNFVLNNAGGALKHAATVREPVSGRWLEISTTEPGLQFYSGNFLTGALVGKGGKAYGFRSGLALETQHFPDSPNHPDFPSTMLKPGQTFRSTTVFRFGRTQ